MSLGDGLRSLFADTRPLQQADFRRLWVANIVNLILNLMLVPDLLGLGVDGAVASAWATFGARTARWNMPRRRSWRLPPNWRA